MDAYQVIDFSIARKIQFPYQGPEARRKVMLTQASANPVGQIQSITGKYRLPALQSGNLTVPYNKPDSLSVE